MYPGRIDVRIQLGMVLMLERGVGRCRQILWARENRICII